MHSAFDQKGSSVQHQFMTVRPARVFAFAFALLFALMLPSSPARAQTDSMGDFIVAWEDDQDGNNVYQILARGFSANGSQAFSDQTVNSVAAGQQLKPAVAMDASGNFVVVWEDDQDGNDVYQILARGFHADGTERFADITVNSVAAGQQLKPAIAMDASGNFVVVWEDDQDGNGVYQILARGFHAGGSERFADITVNSVAAGQQLKPAIAMVRKALFYLPYVARVP
jgi:hypothetical protein